MTRARAARRAADMPPELRETETRMEDEGPRNIDRSHLALPFTPGEWVDVDEVIFQACFEALRLFVEDELCAVEAFDENEIAAADSYRGYRLHSCGGTDETAIDLWLWYRDDLPKMELEYATDIRECFSGSLTFEDTKHGLKRLVIGAKRKPKFPYRYVEDAKEEKLAMLMKIRRALWT